MTIIWILLVLLIVLIILSIRIVHQQKIGIVETMGKFTTTVTPGLNLIVPIFQWVVAYVDLRIVEIKSEVEVKTSDNMFVSMPVALMIRVVESRAAQAYYKLANPERQVQTWAMNSLRATAAMMTLAQLYEDRQAIESKIQQELMHRMHDFGYEIVGVLVDQPSVSLDVQNSFNRVVASRREKEAAEQEAEAKRILILGEAKAEAQAQVLRAQGFAEARKILAESQVSAITDAKANGVAEKDLLDLLIETNRLDTIREAAKSGRLVIMDVSSHSNAPVLSIPTEETAQRATSPRTWP